jgi:homeobox protein cut-like
MVVRSMGLLEMKSYSLPRRIASVLARHHPGIMSALALPHLSSTLAALRSASASSLASKKTLGLQTSTFKQSPSVKSLTNTKVLADIKALLKGYQDEIDKLHGRCKKSDRAFEEVVEAVEKYEKDKGTSGGAFGEEKSASSNNSSSSSSSISRDNKQLLDTIAGLQADVAEYEEELANVKDQSVTIRKLQEKIYQLENDSVSSHDATVTKAVNAARAEAEDEADGKLRDAEERESALQAKVEMLTLELKTERAGVTAMSSRLIDESSHVDKQVAVHEAKAKVLYDEIGVLGERLHDVTRERDELRMQVVVSGRSDSDGGEGGGDQFNDATVQAYEQEVADLTVSVARAKEGERAAVEAQGVVKKQAEEALDSAKQANVKLQEDFNQLKRKLDQAPQASVLEGLQRELRVLKKLHYNSVEGSEEASGADPEVVENDLESVLLGKVKNIEADLIKCRREVGEKTSSVASLTDKLSQVEGDRDRLVTLVEKLEGDLLTTQNKQSQQAHKPRQQGDVLQSIMSPGSPVPHSPFPTFTPNTTTESSEVTLIVQAQRDRLKEKLESLEMERDGLKQELTAQVKKADQLGSDNVKLYEKVSRFIILFCSPAATN